MRTLKPIYPFENVFPSVTKGIVPPLFRDENLPPAIRLDVDESDEAFTLKADLPGARKEDIFVDVDGPVVTLRAELRRDVPEKEGGRLHAERCYGTMTRSVTLPMDVDASATAARYEDGVLWVILPKSPEPSGGRIPVG